MLKTKKNSLLAYIKSTDYDLSLFKGQDSENTETSNFIISLIGTPLTFEVNTLESDFNAHATVFTKFMSGYPRYRFPGREDTYLTSWAQVYTSLRDWLNSEVNPYLNEFEAPDLWEELTSRSPIRVDPLSVYDEEQYRESEIEDIKQRLDIFRLELLEKFKNNDEKIETINLKMDYLTQALERLNRTDWKALALGTLISIGIALNIDTQSGAELNDWISKTSKPITQLLVKQ